MYLSVYPTQLKGDDMHLTVRVLTASLLAFGALSASPVLAQNRATADSAISAAVAETADLRKKLKQRLDFGDLIDVHNPANLAGLVYTLDDNGAVKEILPGPVLGEPTIVSGTDTQVAENDPRNPILFNYFISRKTGAELSIPIIGSLGGGNDDLYRVRYRHVYNVEMPSLRTAEATKALLKYAQALLADGDISDEKETFYLAQTIGIYEFEVEQFTKKKRNAKISGLAFASGGAWYEFENSQVGREYEVSPQPLQLSVRALKAAVASTNTESKAELEAFWDKALADGMSALKAH